MGVVSSPNLSHQSGMPSSYNFYICNNTDTAYAWMVKHLLNVESKQ